MGTLPDGRIALPELFAELHARGVVSVLCEGGATLAGALLEQGLVDRVYAFIAPIWLGDDGLPLARMAGPESPDDARRLTDVRRTAYGDDVLVTGRILGEPTRR